MHIAKLLQESTHFSSNTSKAHYGLFLQFPSHLAVKVITENNLLIPLSFQLSFLVFKNYIQESRRQGRFLSFHRYCTLRHSDSWNYTRPFKVSLGPTHAPLSIYIYHKQEWYIYHIYTTVIYISQTGVKHLCLGHYDDSELYISRRLLSPYSVFCVLLF